VAKTGIVAVTFAVKAICQTVEAYDVKLRAVVQHALDTDVITSEEYDTVILLLNTVGAACIALKKISGYN